MPSKNLCHNLSVCSGFVNFATSKSGGSCRRRQGEMVEWSITPVLKTGIRRRIGGSNPSLSAQSPVSRKICRTFFCYTPFACSGLKILVVMRGSGFSQQV